MVKSLFSGSTMFPSFSRHGSHGSHGSHISNSPTSLRHFWRSSEYSRSPGGRSFLASETMEALEALKKQLGIASSKSIHPSWKASFRYHWFQITLLFYKCRHVSTVTSLARISQQKFQCCTCLRSAAWRASEKFEAGLSASWRGSCSTGGCGWPEFEGLSQWEKTWSSKKWAPISTRKNIFVGNIWTLNLLLISTSYHYASIFQEGLQSIFQKNHMEVTMNRGTWVPLNYPFLFGIFQYNHPATGIPPWLH